MTSAEIQELKEFITQGLGQVRGEIAEGLGEVRGEIAEFRAEHREFQTHVAKHFGEVYQRLRRVEVGQEEMAHEFKAAFEQVSDTNRRVDALESQVERGFSELREEMRFGFQTWGKRVEAVEAHLELNGSGGEVG